MTAARLVDQRAGWLLLAGAGVAVLTACGGDTGTSSSGSGAGSGGAATISAAQTSSGMVLTGPSGNTVYVLLDASGKPLPCTAGCPAVWPVVPTTGTPQAGSGVTAMLATASAADGSTQASANGAPLYYYSGDTGSGQVNGQGLKSFGGTWYAVQTNGQPVSGSGSGATASPRYGY
jgi:predicted lipoprotein with Yx(FWY)xxD motif